MKNSGNLTVTRNVTVGGNTNTAGNTTIGGNLRVRGWLDAPNIKSPCKGLYATADALAEAYPDPLPGWWALVGDTVPAAIYRSDGSVWTDTGETGGEMDIDLVPYDEAIEALSQEMGRLTDAVDHIEIPVTVMDTTEADLILADEHSNPIAVFAGGHISTGKFNSANVSSAQGMARLRLMHWNVGHWSRGQSTDSAVTPETLSEAKRAYSNLLNECAADIVAMCEYEPIFCGNLTARSALFSNYRYHYQAPTQSGYIGTAFASAIEIDHLTEYSLGNGYTAYEGRINIGGSEIVIVECHCPWQSQLLNTAARDILIRRYADTKNVIIAGDMNIYAGTEAENADVWQEAGYMMANWDVLGNITTAIGNVICSNCLDNILIKGGSLVHTRIIETNLSDHYPLITEITFN